MVKKNHVNSTSDVPVQVWYGFNLHNHTHIYIICIYNMHEAGFVNYIWNTKYQFPSGYLTSVQFIICTLIFDLIRNFYSYS